MRRRMLASVGGNNHLPGDYTRVEYIYGVDYGKGNRCYIDTLIKPNHDISIEVDAAVDGFDFDTGGFVGCSKDLFVQGGAWYIYFERINGSVIDQTIQQTSDSTVSVFTSLNPLAVGERAIFEFNRGLTKEVSIRNKRGVFFRFVQAGSYFVEKNIGIFRTITNSWHTYDSYGKLWGAKLWEGGELISELVPCVRLSDGIAGVYDTVRGLFIHSSGVNEFSFVA